ncbi:MAG: uracil-DNA glycosylase [Bryobacteraceae bacterium]|nr:uracil-DNA glycosylase [Bryobacteraceae bacterium]MDW8376713.1 uracil-DNA glycosylase [Bryobacterales bacterium]
MSPARKVPPDTLKKVAEDILRCEKCPRLIAHCRRIAQLRRKAYADWEYWGRPVPSFGDPQARLLVIGLAPGAHGANRTGRIFTGDASGDFLYAVLHRTGFASQPVSRCRGDGLELVDVYITAAARCAPPQNRPTKQELENCRPYLERELRLLPNVRAVVALGRIAFDAYLSILRAKGKLEAARKTPFRHGAIYDFGSDLPVLLASYHPSRQNTSTGRLTEPMLTAVFEQARRLIAGDKVGN